MVVIITPQTINLEGHIKKKEVIVLIDSSSTHNFIQYKLAKVLNFFIYLELEFQVIIVDGGTINLLRKFHNINLLWGDIY